MDCVICCESTTKVVGCSHCTASSCSDCFQAYVLTCGLTVPCMHCRTTLSDEFIVENIRRTPEYLSLRSDLLLSNQKAQMPATQDTVRAYIESKTRLPQMRCVINELQASRRKYNSVGQTVDMLKYVLLPRLEACYKGLGIGWEREDFDRGVRNEEEEEKPYTFIKPCPADSCHGFLSGDQANLSCALCRLKVCAECHEILSGENHECDATTVASVKAIVAESRPCPQCGTAISKVDGCDQMWCTQCHCTFSWRTGLKEGGPRHNPHYYEWMRRTGAIIPRADIGPVAPCAQTRFPTWGKIYKCFPDSVRKEYEELRKGLNLYREFHSNYPTHAGLLAGHIRPPVLKTFLEKLPSLTHYYFAFSALNFMFISMRDSAKHLSGETLDTCFRKCRIRYMANETTLEQFKTQLVEKEFEHMRRRVLYSIHSMVFTVAGDVFSEFMLSNHSITDCHDTYTQLQRLLAYANECIDKEAIVFGTKQEQILNYPRNVYEFAN